MIPHGEALRRIRGRQPGEPLDLYRASLSGASLRGADLLGADLRGADLSWADLRGADLSGASLRGASLRGADLSRADLRGASLRGADLLGADLRGADLLGADLRGADLSWADLRGADLSWADLRGADLSWVHWHGLRVDGLPSGQATFTPTCDGWHLRVGCWAGTVADLRALIAGENWPGADTPEERDRRRPGLLAVADLCEAHIAAHAGVIADLAERWGTDTEVAR